ncbi:TetR/AcrR family transcriptional regulator [Pseudomonas sp. MDT1-16]
MEETRESDAVIARRAKVAANRKERSKLALLAAAFELLGQVSGRINNVDAVIARAGVTRGTFYNHYGSLDELLAHLSWEITHDFNLAVLRYLGTINSPAEEATIFTKAYLQRTEKDPKWGWGMVNLSSYGPILGAASHKMCESNVKRGIESGEYSCLTHRAGRDIALGSLFAAMNTVLLQGNSRGHISSVVIGVLRALGVQHDRAMVLAKQRMPVIPYLATRDDSMTD